MDFRKRRQQVHATPEDDDYYRQLVAGYSDAGECPPSKVQAFDQSCSSSNENSVEVHHTDHLADDINLNENPAFSFTFPEEYDDYRDRISAFDEFIPEAVHYDEVELQDVDAFEVEDEDEPEDQIEADSPLERPVLPSSIEAILIAFMNQIKSNQTDLEASRNAKLINMGFSSPVIKSTDVRCMRRKVPNAFNPKVVKFFYSQGSRPDCDALVLHNFADLKVSSPACSNGHRECGILNPGKVVKQDGSHYCYVPLSAWLLYLVPLFFSLLRLDYHKDRNSIYLHDLCDGSVYKEIVDPKADYPTLTITLTWDGVETTQQGTKSIWPVCAYLNELPFTIRMINAMLLALHASSTKPSGDQMFRPIVEELLQFEKKPLVINVNGTEHKFFVKLLFFIADGPARALALNCCGHTCKFGCHMCDTEFPYSSKFKVPIFKTLKSGSIKYRSNSTWSRYAEAAKGSKEEHFRGVKGPCELMKLKYIKLHRLCPSEILHSLYEGTVKSILKRWLDLDLDKVWFSLLEDSEKKKLRKRHMLMSRTRTIEELDKRLIKIKFPSRVLRQMPLLRHKGQFKAMEYELLLLYGCFCMDGIIRNESLENFKLLALIVSKLCARNIDPQELSSVRILVDHFLRTFEKLYGNKMEQFMWKSNVHHVAHLVDMTEWYGPLFIQSAYPTEGTNGVLARKVVTGTNLSPQVFNKYLNQFSVLGAVQTSLTRSNCSSKYLKTVEELFPKLLKPANSILHSVVVHDPTMRSYATTFSMTGLLSTQTILQSLINDNPDLIFQSLKRARWLHPEFGRQSICTQEYDIAKSTNNHTIKILTPSGTVKFYLISLILQDLNSKKIWIFGKEFVNCTPVALKLSSMSEAALFDYAFTYERISSCLTILDPKYFSELVTYVESVNGKNFILDFFRHM